MTRSVWRKRLKVIGLSLSTLMLALWLFSVLFTSAYIRPSRQWSISLSHGRIGFGDYRGNNPAWTCVRCYPSWRTIGAKLPRTEFAHHFLGFGMPWRLGGRLVIPVWLLVVAVGFPTAVLWWRDRRPKAGFCKVCEYDLTGNVSGTCPECGTAVE